MIQSLDCEVPSGLISLLTLLTSQSTHHSSVSFGHAHRRRRRREVGEPNGTGDEWSEEDVTRRVSDRSSE